MSTFSSTNIRIYRKSQSSVARACFCICAWNHPTMLKRPKSLTSEETAGRWYATRSEWPHRLYWKATPAFSTATTMTETEWQNVSEPHAMLQFLRDKASDRKLRLFAVACSRRIWNLIDDLGRVAVEAAEGFADGNLGPDELRAARLACRGVGGQASWYTAATNPEIAARNAALSAQAGVANNPLLGAEAGELLAQAALVREIFGPQPFRQITVDPTWLTPTVVQLARTIYDDRAFDRMQALADALHEAGCDNDEILAHCRGPGPHVHGCWALDLIVRKA
jgi:hypothetical protein